MNALTEEQHLGLRRCALRAARPYPNQRQRSRPGDCGPRHERYLPVEGLRRLFAQAWASKAGRVTAYCGGGIAASNGAFILTLLGHENVAVYDASIPEWAIDPSLPMETG